MYTVPFCGMKKKANDEMTVSPKQHLSDIFKNLFRTSNCFTVHCPEKILSKYIYVKPKKRKPTGSNPAQD